MALSPDAAPPEHAAALARGRPDDVGLGAQVRERSASADDRTVQSQSHDDGLGDGTVQLQSHDDGLGDRPSSGSRDVAAYGQTESQECSALARTLVRADELSTPYGVYPTNTVADRQTVDGDACTGHEWNAKFESFCTFLSALGQSCAVPDAFDTTWRVADATFDGYTRAQSLFTCSDFPAIPDTVATVQDLELRRSGGSWTFSFDHAVGVLPGAEVRDYGEFDANALANLAVDGFAALFPDAVVTTYSYALGAWLLTSSAGVV